jgi:hypothetical protein
MKPFTSLAILFFALIALVHLYRLVRPFGVTVGSMAVPQWASVIGALVPALLALMVWRESRVSR